MRSDLILPVLILFCNIILIIILVNVRAILANIKVILLDIKDILSTTTSPSGTPTVAPPPKGK